MYRCIPFPGLTAANACRPYHGHLSFCPRQIRAFVTADSVHGRSAPLSLQLLSAAALLYPVYRDCIRVTPVFDREVLEGELKLEGRIRLAVLLGAAVRLGMDRNFRKLVRRLMDR